jgi:hypothetical protein
MVQTFVQRVYLFVPVADCGLQTETMFIFLQTTFACVEITQVAELQGTIVEQWLDDAAHADGFQKLMLWALRSNLCLSEYVRLCCARVH